MDYFGLDDDERVIAETAAEFAEKRIAPYALEWDAEKHFPTDVLRAAAELGMAAIYCQEDAGGSGFGPPGRGRLAPPGRGPHFRAGGDRLPDDLGVPVDPQHVHVDGRHLRHRRTAQE